MDVTYIIIAVAAVVALGLLLSRDVEGFGNLDPGVQQHVNRKVEQYIRKKWSSIKKSKGFDQPLDTYFKWYGRGIDTYGCKRSDGTAKNFQLCKRWARLNNRRFTDELKLVMAVQKTRKKVNEKRAKLCPHYPEQGVRSWCKYTTRELKAGDACWRCPQGYEDTGRQDSSQCVKNDCPSIDDGEVNTNE